MRAAEIQDDLAQILVTEEEISPSSTSRGAGRHDYEGKDLVLVGVLKGAVMVMADFLRGRRRSTHRWTGWRSRSCWSEHQVERRGADPQASCTPTSTASTS